VVVDVAGAVAAVVAVHGFARVSVVGVVLDRAFRDLQIILGDDGVQSVRSSGELFASVTVTQDVACIRELDGPLDLSAMAFSLHGHLESLL